MRKSTLFVSAMLTVFLMATMFGVASAYQQAVNGDSRFLSRTPDKIASQSIDPVSMPISMVGNAPVAVEVPQTVTPEEATLVAVDYLGDPEVYSVEVVDYQGAFVYLVTFSSGDMVYVSAAGEILATDELQPVIVAAPPVTNNGGSQSNNNSGNSGDEEHESHDDDDDDHDDHDDD